MEGVTEKKNIFPTGQQRGKIVFAVGEKSYFCGKFISSVHTSAKVERSVCEMHWRGHFGQRDIRHIF